MLTYRIIRWADLSPQPWQNGGGSTVTLMSEPKGAAADAVQWRVSVASIEGGSRFSEFPGLDRWLAPLSGGGLTFEIDADVRELSVGEVVRFPGEAAVSATPHEPRSTDLNLMVRRDALAATLRELRLDAGAAPHEVAVAPGETVLLFAVSGPVSIDAREPVTLHAHDALVVSDPSVAVRILGPAHLFEARVSPVR